MDLTRFFRITRLKDWWFFKVPYLLLACYLILYNTRTFFEIELLIDLLIILSGIILGAFTIGFIGEYYDKDQDNAASKPNGLNKLKYKNIVILFLVLLLLNSLFIAFCIGNFYAQGFYTLSLACFFLYYNAWIRLKERSYLGIISDSLGSQCLPVFFIYAVLMEPKDLSLDLEIIILCAWLFLVGLRGIINHQYLDRVNDTKSGTKTYVTQIGDKQKKWFQKIVFSLEIITLLWVVVIFKISIPFLIIALAFYLIILISRKINYNNTLTYFDVLVDKPFTNVLFEFYFFLLPNVILIQLIYLDYRYILFVILHASLFFKLYKDYLIEFYEFSRRIFQT